MGSEAAPGSQLVGGWGVGVRNRYSRGAGAMGWAAGVPIPGMVVGDIPILNIGHQSTMQVPAVFTYQLSKATPIVATDQVWHLMRPASR